MYRINHANIKEWAANYDGPLFDGILCDPPYELGFMGKSWDSSGIAFDTEMWADILKLLKPGGHLLAFSGSRTYHRMAVAIEDAGFEIRDMIEWVYGSGFPKALDISKAIDKMNGHIGEVIGTETIDTGIQGGSMHAGRQTKLEQREIRELSGQAKLWQGYKTALKPAHEPCVLARKPIEGTVANNVLKHGTGGLNIDGTRVGYGNESDSRIGTDAKAGGSQESQFGSFSNVKDKNIQMYKSEGRFPANLIHDGSDEVVGLFPETKQPSMRKGDRASKVNGIVPWNKGRETGRTVTNAGYTDIGSAARFFYTAKASKSERNAGLEGFEDRRAGAMEFRNRESEKGQFEGEPQYAKNHHPTVKPLSLTKYLATLIKPPTGGRLLVPFSGSGSEMIGALQAGWEYVEGVELTEEYIPIAEARIEHWLAQMNKQLEIL